jgi:hypothetical protein
MRRGKASMVYANKFVKGRSFTSRISYQLEYKRLMAAYETAPEHVKEECKRELAEADTAKALRNLLNTFEDPFRPCPTPLGIGDSMWPFRETLFHEWYERAAARVRSVPKNVKNVHNAITKEVTQMNSSEFKCV